MVKTKIVSSLEKALLTDNIEKFPSLSKISALRGERISVQLLHTYVCEGDEKRNGMLTTPRLSGSLAKYATMFEVGNVPVERPLLLASGDDDNYISKLPGLYPDVLRPLLFGGCAVSTTGVLFSIFIEIDLPYDIEPGNHTLKITLNGEDRSLSEEEIAVEVIDAALPKQTLYYTQWFHCDCLASYYNVEVWSDRHWQIVENFARTARRNGINLLLTPIFTPPLDTEVGGERLTTQLVGVKRENGIYSFDFTLLDRWVDMCDRVGIEYFEIAHLFTQWGAAHAPKVMATVNGEYKKIFGWETNAQGDEYREFLRTFIPAFLSHMKKRGDDKRCFFHISDEPITENLENYKAAKGTVADLLEGYTIMDAISHYEFYEMGILDTPIPSNDHIQEFLDHKVKNLWTYYCCMQLDKVSNRMIQMPSYRTRSIGYQMYKYDIVGFLQWGFNFYNSRRSRDFINPYSILDAGGYFPAGDAFSVYPAQNGEALDSIRFVIFYEAIQDISAMKLCEEYYGKERLIEVIEEFIGKEVTFDVCATNAAQILGMREKINEMIKAKVAE